MTMDFRPFDRAPTIVMERLHPDAVRPAQGSFDAVGFDICVAEGGLIEPFSGAVFGTGWRFLIPVDYEMQVRSRSGLSSKGLIVGNTPATIDPDYRGELKIILRNLTGEAFLISPGERVAQLVIAPRLLPVFVEGEVPVNTGRGENGLGSTGIRALIG